MPILSDPTREDSDGDSYTDNQDLAPMIPFINPIMLIHGRASNTADTYGLYSRICERTVDYTTSAHNNNYDCNYDDNGNFYSDIKSQIITLIKPNTISSYFVGKNYKPNKNMFIFNYPNQDFAVNNSPKLSAYINEIKKCVTGEISVPDSFLATESDIFATKDDLENKHARFILIGHSNGGLVSRYYIENYGGNFNVDKLITIYYRSIRKVCFMEQKQTEIRKLDWSLFQKDNQFCNGMNKGIAFENLVEQLIRAMFPMEKWRRTQKSHDEKRDFVYPNDETLPDEKWAECKNYNENLSINTIAPTLVMGAINQIQCIYFFSYSQLNDNAIEGILRYAALSKKKVNIFDGVLLDNLIIKYSRQIDTETFFPNDDFSALSYGNKAPFRLICMITNINNNKVITSPKFSIGAKFVLKIMLQNLMPIENSFSYEVKSEKIKLSRK